PRVEAYEFVLLSIMHDMCLNEETVAKKAYAVIDNGQRLIPGIMSYYGETVEGQKAAAFVQVVDSEEDDGYRVTEEQVKAGLCVLPIDEEEAYVVNSYAAIPSFSVIYNDYYLIYKQTDKYVVEISCTEKSKATYDDVDLYDMDTSSWVFRQNVEFDENRYTVTSMYSNEAQAYASAKLALEKIIQLQNENSNSAEVKTLILISEDVLEQMMLSNQEGMVNNYFLKDIEGLELQKDEIVIITSEGIRIEKIPEILANERKVNGILNLIASTLMLAGSIAVAAVTYGAGSGLVISSIAYISSGIVYVYSTSNMIGAVSDIYYGSINDIHSESFNPVLELLKKQINDPEKATTLYHAIGISASVLQSLIIPAQGAIKISTSTGASFFKTTLNVTRAVLTESVKIALTASTSILVSTKVNELMENVTDSYALKQFTTFASGMLSGAFVYGGLTSIDKSVNISGLYPKTAFLKGYNQITKAQSLSKFEDDVWNNLSDFEKKLAIRKMVGEISDDLGLDKTPSIRYFRKNSNTLGYCDGDNIYINVKYLDNGVELLDTVAHELCHARQYQDCLRGVVNEITDNYINYIPYEESLGNYKLYYNQPVEVEARAYAETWTNLLGGMNGK
ncbi:MAG: hypothetical protein IKA02_05795, partial [Clostridia bacterium]|nr:hypothetical protein [Clostridia bacterium]